MDCALLTTWIDLLASSGKHPIAIDIPRCSVHLVDTVVTLHIGTIPREKAINNSDLKSVLPTTTLLLLIACHNKP